MNFNKLFDAFTMGFLVFIAVILCALMTLMVVSFAAEYGIALTAIAVLAFILFFAILTFIGHKINERL